MELIRKPNQIFLCLVAVVIIYSQELVAKKESFAQWKKSYAKRASKRGLPKKFVLKLLKPVKLNKKVISLDKNQVLSNSKVSYKKFIKRWLRKEDGRAKRGLKEIEENRALLEKVERKYGVEKEVIVSLWGTETFYGDITGNYNLVESLSSLAYDGRRRTFFETQLNSVLRLIKKGHATQDDLKGSWAGATGQCQFMPSNIWAYAQDFNGDGKIDIWNTKADIFASIANFLKNAGWKKRSSIGSLVIPPDRKVRNLNIYRSPAQYNKLGFKKLNGSTISNVNWRKRKVAVIPLSDSPYVLRGGNYKAIIKWNNSSLFAAFNILLMDYFHNH
ncbi:lytic murein transglycosylase [Bacteriovoracaceae bacterium]|nr:lytic murein transglycosylase [Bacteriovoracaceae bacterium]